MFHYVLMFHVFDNVMYLFDCRNLCITKVCIVCHFYIFHTYFVKTWICSFGRRPNNILSYLIRIARTIPPDPESCRQSKYLSRNMHS